MTALSPDNTARLYVDYTATGKEHTVIFRPQTGVTIEQLRDWVHDWLTDNAALFATTTVFHDARHSLQNSNVTNPISWTAVVGTSDVPADVDRAPRFGSFVGRSAQGHRVKFGIYGIAFVDDASYRWNAAESAGVTNAVADLNDLQAKLGTITGSKAVWKQYMNTGYNAYWQRKARRG